MIIKNLNTIDLDKVIKQEDVDYITNAKSHADKLIKNANNILDEAKKEVERVKKEAYDTTTKDLITNNENNLNEFNSEADKFIETITKQTANLIYKLLAKFGQDNISTETIKNIINKELGKNRIIDITKITANKNSINKLKETLNLIYFEAIVWEVDDSYNDDECLCSTKLWSMRVSIGYVVNAVLNRVQEFID
jgi:hypothetical protein